MMSDTSLDIATYRLTAFEQLLSELQGEDTAAAGHMAAMVLAEIRQAWAGIDVIKNDAAAVAALPAAD